MTHDPYQTYATLAAYNPGLANPFAAPYSPMQTSGINPGAGAQGYAGIPGLPNYAQQLQLASQAIIPQLMALSQFSNPWQNPFAGALQNPLLNPILAQLAAFSQPYSPFQQPYQQQHHQQQIGNPLAAFGQQVSPFNSPLAPQSWVGQGLAGQIGQFPGNQGFGQSNPLLMQLAARALQGGSPWGGF